MTDDEVRETVLSHLRQAEALTQGSAEWLAAVEEYETARAELESRDIARTQARLVELDAQPGHPPAAGKPLARDGAVHPPAPSRHDRSGTPKRRGRPFPVRGGHGRRYLAQEVPGKEGKIMPRFSKDDIEYMLGPGGAVPLPPEPEPGPEPASETDEEEQQDSE